MMVGDFGASEKKSNINNRQREREETGGIDYERALPSKIGIKSNVQAYFLSYRQTKLIYSTRENKLGTT